MTINKLLVTIVASTFALSSAASFAANGAMKLEDLTKEQRTEMRSRADQLTADRAAGRSQMKAVSQPAPKVKNPGAVKAKAGSRS